MRILKSFSTLSNHSISCMIKWFKIRTRSIVIPDILRRHPRNITRIYRFSFFQFLNSFQDMILCDRLWYRMTPTHRAIAILHLNFAVPTNSVLNFTTKYSIISNVWNIILKTYTTFYIVNFFLFVILLICLQHSYRLL